MDNENSQPLTAEENSPSAPAPRPPVQRIFYNNEQRLRAGWRLVSYIILVVLFSIAINLVLSKIFHVPKTPAPAPWQLFLQECLAFLLVFLPALLMSVIERRSVGDYGLPLRMAFGARFWQGCALGVVEIALLMACIALFHGYSFGPLNIHGTAILKWALFWAACFVLVGLFEEFTFRGYLQFTLADGIGFWPAAWILSVGFGGVHLMNKGESWVGAASVVTIGLVFALALKRTGNLWFLVGWHAAFDFGETFLFSVPNSGNVFEGHLSNSSLHGPTWLTGGTVGPEGSVFSFITMAAAAFFIHKVFPPRDTAEQVSATATHPAAVPE
jgi:membrane protease YdiL (CAAX protease family)